MGDILITGDSLPMEVENDIVELLTQLAELEKKQKTLKERLKTEMLNRDLIKMETDKLTITYVAPTTKETFDSKSFRAKHPDMYDEFVKISEVKDCVKVVVK